MSAHTPGPWRLEKMRAPNGGTYYRVFPDGQDDATVCIAQVILDGHCAYHDNARLIAAAPELLAALQLFTEFRAGLGKTGAKVSIADVEKATRAAIAKAVQS